MVKYLLIILIFITNIKTNVVFSQIITISPAGRKIISHVKPDNHKLVIACSVIPVDSGQLIVPQNDVDIDRQLNFEPIEIVFPPLRGKLYVTSDFGERFHPILHNETLHAGIDLRADYLHLFMNDQLTGDFYFSVSSFFCILFFINHLKK